MSTAAIRCLQSATHLACVRGPDRGCVFPVAAEVVLGRGRLGLADPHLSRSEVIFSVDAGPRGVVRALPVGRGEHSRTRHEEAARGAPLRAGTRLRLGSDRWIVRKRPQTLKWPEIEARSQARFARLGVLVMPLMLITLVIRIAPSLLAVTLALGAVGLALALITTWQRRRWKQWDEARLLMVLTALSGGEVTRRSGASKSGPRDADPRSETEASFRRRSGAPAGGRTRAQGGAMVWKPRVDEGREVRVLRKPGAKRSIAIGGGPGSIVAVVGAAAFPYAQWIAAQLRVLGVSAMVRETASEDPTSLGHRPDAPAEDGSRVTVDVVWCESITRVPVNAALVLAARPVGSASWSRQIASGLQPQAPLPPRCDLADLLESDPADESGRAADGVAIGVCAHGPFYLNLATDGPHALVVGGTGSGKSEFLTTFVLAHALAHSPEELRIVLIDFKGGAGLSHLAWLPHVEHCLSDLDGAEVPWLLRALSAVLHRRKLQLLESGSRSWDELTPSAPRLHVIVDEFHVLAQQHPDLMDELVTIASQGRSLGFHLVLATQRPSGAISAQMRATLDLRVALRCLESADSIAAIGTTRAAEIPRIPGRCLINGSEVQTALSTDPAQWQERARHKGNANGKIVPDPLPAAVNAQTLARGHIGVFEVPGQGNLPLTIGTESVAIVGPVSTADELSQMATTVVRAASWTEPAAPRHQSPLLGPAAFHHGGAVAWVDALNAVGPATRIINRLLEDVETVAMPEEAEPLTPAPTLVIDGVSNVFAKIEVAARPDLARDLWQRVLAAVQGGRLRLIATDTRSRYDFSVLPARLVRIPDRRQLLSPDLSPYLPTVLPSSEGLPLQRASDLERFASPVPGRVLAQGLGGTDAAWAQVGLVEDTGTAKRPGSPPTPMCAHGESDECGRSSAPRPGRSAPASRPTGVRVSHQFQPHRSHGIRRSYASSAGITAAARAQIAEAASHGETIWLVSAEYTAPDVRSPTGVDPQNDDPTNPPPPRASVPWSGSVPPPQVRRLHPDRWTVLAGRLRDTIVVEEPGAEIVRMLCQRHPEQAVWALASQPYRHGETLISTASGLHFAPALSLILPLLDSDPEPGRISRVTTTTRL